MQKLDIDKNMPQNQRPYYINEDNVKSDYKISQPHSCFYYNNLNNIMGDQKLTKSLIIDHYFDTIYLIKVKKEAIKLK